MRNLLIKFAQFLGHFLGSINHFFRGCGKHWVYIKNNRKGKFTARKCIWCGKREDRKNGKWILLGRYKIKGKK